MTPVMVRVVRTQAADAATTKTVVWEAARTALGAALGVAATDVVFSRTCQRCGDAKHGKPFVVGAPQLSFSLTHSGNVGLVAIAENAVVGIDAELVKPRARLDQLTARVMDANALEAWAARDESERLEAFLRAWTAKEAYLKAIGLGIATNLREAGEPPPGWTAHRLDRVPQYVAALVVDRPAEIVDTDER